MNTSIASCVNWTQRNFKNCSLSRFDTREFSGCLPHRFMQNRHWASRPVSLKKKPQPKAKGSRWSRDLQVLCNWRSHCLYLALNLLLLAISWLSLGVFLDHGGHQGMQWLLCYVSFVRFWIAPRLPATWFKPYGLSHDSHDVRCGIEGLQVVEHETCHWCSIWHVPSGSFTMPCRKVRIHRWFTMI